MSPKRVIRRVSGTSRIGRSTPAVRSAGSHSDSHPLRQLSNASNRPRRNPSTSRLDHRDPVPPRLDCPATRSLRNQTAPGRTGSPSDRLRPDCLVVRPLQVGLLVAGPPSAGPPHDRTIADRTTSWSDRIATRPLQVGPSRNRSDSAGPVSQPERRRKRAVSRRTASRADLPRGQTTSWPSSKRDEPSHSACPRTSPPEHASAKRQHQSGTTPPPLSPTHSRPCRRVPPPASVAKVSLT